MKLSDFLQDIGRPIAYYPSLARLLGGINESIFLSQIIYWTGKEASGDGWIYKTSSEIESELGLTYREQMGARKRLRRLGVLSEEYRRLKHVIYFSVNFDYLNHLWDRHMTKCHFGNKQNVSSGNDKMSVRYKESENTTENTFKDKGAKLKFSSDVTLSLEEFLLREEKDTFNPDAIEAVNIFLGYYRKVFGEPHPRLKPKQWRSVLDTILECTDCHGRTHYFNSSDLEYMIAAYFTTRFQEGCNYSILHFSTDGVKSNRYFETCFGGRSDV